MRFYRITRAYLFTILRFSQLRERKQRVGEVFAPPSCSARVELSLVLKTPTSARIPLDFYPAVTRFKSY